MSRTYEGLKYVLSFEKPALKSDEPVRGKLRIAVGNGAPFTRLEPVMGAFVHLVGFNEDYKSVLHMHPVGAEIVDTNARGGPELEFMLYTTKPGFYPLFAQVQISGRMMFVPFGLIVQPSAARSKSMISAL